MFCPYVRKSFIQVVARNHNDDMFETSSGVFEEYVNAECKKEQCGVWYKGRCRYNGKI